MADMKFQVGDPVFFYTMIDRIPGVIESVEQNENDKWIYSIKVGNTMIARNVPENRIEKRVLSKITIRHKNTPSEMSLLEIQCFCGVLLFY